MFIRISLKLQICLIPTQHAAKPFLKVILKICADCRELGVGLDTSDYKWAGSFSSEWWKCSKIRLCWELQIYSKSLNGPVLWYQSIPQWSFKKCPRVHILKAVRIFLEKLSKFTTRLIFISCQMQISLKISSGWSKHGNDLHLYLIISKGAKKPLGS